MHLFYQKFSYNFSALKFIRKNKQIKNNNKRKKRKKEKTGYIIFQHKLVHEH